LGKLHLTLSGMNCSSCVSKINNLLSKYNFIDESNINLVTSTGVFYTHGTNEEEVKSNVNIILQTLTENNINHNIVSNIV